MTIVEYNVGWLAWAIEGTHSTTTSRRSPRPATRLQGKKWSMSSCRTADFDLRRQVHSTFQDDRVGCATVVAGDHGLLWDRTTPTTRGPTRTRRKPWPCWPSRSSKPTRSSFPRQRHGAIPLRPCRDRRAAPRLRQKREPSWRRDPKASIIKFLRQADNHYYEPVDMFARCIDAALRPDVPRTEEHETGMRALRRTPLRVRRWQRSKHHIALARSRPTCAATRGRFADVDDSYTSDPKARLTMMDERGVEETLMFPSTGVTIETCSDGSPASRS